MPLRSYQKSPATPVAPTSQVFSSSQHSEMSQAKRSDSFRKVHLFPAILVTLGSVLIANVTWPIIQHQLFVSKNLQNETANQDNTAQPQAQFQTLPTVQAEELEAARSPMIINSTLDYTNLSQWFSDFEMPLSEEQSLSYTISIPSLGIEDALVQVGGLNLDQSLIQYPGTANPGELGSPIIFGHSVSPIFYNPSINNARRYVSIFTKIMQLQAGDQIFVTYDGIRYVYRVTNKTEVKPDDTYILEQRYDQRELKLVTCTPPGTYLRRGIVFAQLEDIQ